MACRKFLFRPPLSGRLSAGDGGGAIHLPRPPPPPLDIDTMEPIEPPWQAIKEWIPDDEPDLNWFNQARPPSDSEPDSFDQSPDWRPEEIPLGDGRTLILEDS